MRRNSAGQFARPRPNPADLEFRAPDCPMCAKETDCDGDSFTCYPCGASWGRGGTNGSWDDPDQIGCPSTIEWWNRERLAPEHENIRNLVEHCSLADGHAGEHRAMDFWFHWDGDDPRIVKKGNDNQHPE